MRESSNSDILIESKEGEKMEINAQTVIDKIVTKAARDRAEDQKTIAILEAQLEAYQARDRDNESSTEPPLEGELIG